MKAKTSMFAVVAMASFLLAGCDFLKTTTGQAIMDYVLQAVVLIVTPVVLLLAKRVVQIVEQKTGLAASAHQLALVDDAVYKGVAYAEEQGRKAFKVNEPIPDGNMKRQMATEFALDMVKNHNAAEISRDYLLKMVEAHVNLARDPADKKVANAPV